MSKVCSEGRVQFEDPLYEVPGLAVFEHQRVVMNNNH